MKGKEGMEEDDSEVIVDDERRRGGERRRWREKRRSGKEKRKEGKGKDRGIQRERKMKLLKMDKICQDATCHETTFLQQNYLI
jgi:hypothetical protein